MSLTAAVMGAGSWGTAFGAVLADAGTSVTVWGRRPDTVAAINAGCNDAYLPGVALPRAMRATTDASTALAGADLVVLAVPAQHLRATLAEWSAQVPSDATLVSLLKGIELGTTMRVSEVVVDAAGVASDRVVVVSGPNLAGEIARKQPAATVVAGRDPERTYAVAQACATAYFRPITSGDVIGAELGGAAKNVVALAVGMAEGMGMGDNTRASIVTRGLAETARLGVRLGADPQTFMGLAGVGDLIATCMSPLSRNRAFGESLGKGLSVGQASEAIWQTTEGVSSCRSVLALAQRHGLEMPIAEAVAAVIDGRLTPRQIVELLMTRQLKHERL